VDLHHINVQACGALNRMKFLRRLVSDYEVGHRRQDATVQIPLFSPAEMITDHVDQIALATE
jgi:hypothetical protein